jgi:hypothetical protein
LKLLRHIYFTSCTLSRSQSPLALGPGSCQVLPMVPDSSVATFIWELYTLLPSRLSARMVGCMSYKVSDERNAVMPEQNHPPLETDGMGNVITKPVTGWSTVPVAGIAVLLAVRYVDTPEELERGDSKSIQLVLKPQQCLELAEALKKLGTVLLAGQSDSMQPVN